MLTNLDAVLCCMLAGMLALVILCLVLIFRLAALKRSYRRLVCGRERLNLEELFDHLNSQIKTEQQKSDNLSHRVTALDARTSRLVGLGLVRFNAFQDTGSDLSFSLALINHAGDGAVVTSIFGREENRLYGKPVEQGGSRHPLSQEEQVALRKAQEAINN